MEGPSAPLEKNEKALITDEQCLEAMKAENFELVRAWYAEQEKVAEQDPTPQGHLNLIIKQAKLQLDADLRDDAFETLEVAHWDAMNRNDFETARRLEDITAQLKEH